MLRPATPLSVLLGIAFGLLLISVLSVPIIEAIPLGEFKDVKFGVFGYCSNKDGCTGIGIGYKADKLFPSDRQAFDLPGGVRDTLSIILIVHPVAAFLALVLFVLAAAAHLHSASHSTRYLLIIFIFSLVDFLVCLCAFLVDVLLFIPHLAWGSYVVLAATILVAMSGLVSCAMRRTLISRKERHKRIADNAEMSGENYYNREAQVKTEEITRQPTMPVVSGAINEKNPNFASFEDPLTQQSTRISDEQVPLTRRSPSQTSPNQPPIEMSNMSGFSNGPRRMGSRDQYDAPINAPTNAPMDAYGVRRDPSMDRMNSRGRGDRGPPGGFRGGRGGGYGRGGYDNYGAPMHGRGGYAPPGRGGYGPRGGRGGYGPPPRGAYAAGGMRGGRTPPPGYNNNNIPGPYDRRPSPAGGNYPPQPPEPSNGFDLEPNANPSLPNVNAGYQAYKPDTTSFPRAESPPPLPGTESAIAEEQVVEMDATPAGQHNYGTIRDSDTDVAGMIGLQQGRMPERHETMITESSRYSTDDVYVPPRAAWNQDSGRSSPQAPPPLHVQTRKGAEQNTPPAAPSNSGNYYEDIDPRFAANPSQANYPPPIEPIYEDVHAAVDGARSPAESERSNFTSISQRGINPRWNPNSNPPPMPYRTGPTSRQPQPQPQSQQSQQRQDMLLDNPDFQLPGARSRGPHRGAPGMIPGSAYPAGPL